MSANAGLTLCRHAMERRVLKAHKGSAHSVWPFGAAPRASMRRQGPLGYYSYSNTQPFEYWWVHENRSIWTQCRTGR
jgi:hypothetical protein